MGAKGARAGLENGPRQKMKRTKDLGLRGGWLFGGWLFTEKSSCKIG